LNLLQLDSPDGFLHDCADYVFEAHSGTAGAQLTNAEVRSKVNL